MKLFYGDDSEIYGLKHINCPNIFAYGGIVIDTEHINQLKDTIEAIKRDKIGYERAPIKWNFKDLIDQYKKLGKLDLFNKALKDMHSIRTDIFSTLNDTDCTIYTSLIEAYSENKKKIKETGFRLRRYAFANCVMRVGLFVKEDNGTALILDWPVGNSTHLYGDEYANAYNNGKSADGSVPYDCGSLKDIKFSDSPLYAKMVNSTLLQMGDLCVGLLTSYIRNIHFGEPNDQIDELYGLIESKIENHPNVFQRGLSVSSSSKTLHKEVQAHYSEV